MRALPVAGSPDPRVSVGLGPVLPVPGPAAPCLSSRGLTSKDPVRHWPFQLPLVLPELRVLPTPMQIFMFSAVTWNRHHIHYSAEAARAEGHPDVVVQRSLIGNYFARHAGAWLGPEGRIGRLSWRVVGSAVPHQWLRCNGVVQDRLDEAGGAVDGSADAPLRLHYQAWLTAEGEREVATAEGVLCIQSPF